MKRRNEAETLKAWKLNAMSMQSVAEIYLFLSSVANVERKY